MKKLLLLTLLSLTIATNVSTKRFNFEINPNINQVDFSQVIGNSNGLFIVEILYIDNFNSIFEIAQGGSEPYFETSATYDCDEDEDDCGPGNPGIKLEGNYGSFNCILNPVSVNADFVTCHQSDMVTLLIDSGNTIWNFYENDYEGCSGTENCNWQLSGDMYVDITGPFDDGLGSNDDIDDLQAQIDELVEQLTECVDCEGDVSGNDLVNVQDIIILVEHIIDADAGDCYSQQ